MWKGSFDALEALWASKGAIAVQTEPTAERFCCTGAVTLVQETTRLDAGKDPRVRLEVAHNDKDEPKSAGTESLYFAPLRLYCDRLTAWWLRGVGDLDKTAPLG